MASTEARLDPSGASAQVRAVLEEVRNFAEAIPEPGEQQESNTWHEMLVEAFDQQLSPSEVHRKRKKLTFSAFADSMIIPKAIALENLVEPNAARIHKMFGRSETIATLQRLPLFVTEERAKLEKKCLD